MRLPELVRSAVRGEAGGSRALGTVGSLGINNLNDYAAALSSFGFNGLGYTYGGGPPPLQTTQEGMTAEPIPDDFCGLVRSAYKANGVIFSVMLARMLAFAAVRFSYQRINVGKPSELFGDRSLSLLEEPWTGGTTQDLLTRTINDADLGGNSYWTERFGQLWRLRPDWTYIVAGLRMVPALRTDNEGRALEGPIGWERVGYIYCDGGLDSEQEPIYLDASEVAHFAPIPDPEARFRGMSWLTPIIREVQADQLMTRHRIKFFENAATPNMVVKHDVSASPEKVQRFNALLQEQNAGVENAYKTLNLYPGADATVVGANLEQLEFKVTQGGGETRIAGAGRVPPIIVGLSEGLQAATYSNYGQARRAFADGTCHPLWGNAAGSFGLLRRNEIDRLANGGIVRLWYDARDVPLLREDAKEAAEISEIQARTIRTYVDGGYTPDSARRAVIANDLGLLEHTGLYSVQLREPGAEEPPAAPPAPAQQQQGGGEGA